MLRRLRRANRRALIAGTGTAGALALAIGVAGAAVAGVPINPFGTNHVGTQADGSVMLPDNQLDTAYGQRTLIPGYAVGMAVSPDGSKIAVQTGADVVGAPSVRHILDAATGTILQTFGAGGGTAPLYSPDGTALYAATTTFNVTQHDKVFGIQPVAPLPTSTILKYSVGPDGLVTNPTTPEEIPLSTGETAQGLAISPDGTKLYFALNATNQLGVIDTTTDQVTARIPVGNAPQAVAIVGDQAFVANRGGRPAGPGDTTVDSDGTPIVTDPATGSASTGTVSVVNLLTNAVTATIKVGLQPSSLTVHDGSVFVTNSNSDTVSIIDATSHRVNQTFNVEPLPGSTVGASPNSVAFPDPYHLLVTVEGDNAIAEYVYNGPRTPVQYEGLIPTDWRPDQLQYDAQLGKVFVNSERGVGTDGAPITDPPSPGSVTSFTMPSNPTLGTLTQEVFVDNGWNHPPASNASGSTNAQGGPLPAIPARLGQPSAIKHVFLLINENKTYDSVLGDIGKGNSDPSLATFGAQVTPNKHSLANTFSLFDNFYDPSTLSYDGHNWLDQAGNDDYITQNEAADNPRDVVGIGTDALTAQRSGFLWNTVERAGKSVKDYGEYAADGPIEGTPGTWQQYYADSQILEGQASGPLPVPENQFETLSAFPGVNAIADPFYPSLNHNVPDQYRADLWDQDFQQQLRTNSVPNLTILWLPNDHTGVAPTTPDAQVADTDLADGRIISEISHSPAWKNSAIFTVEDDAATTSDHIDGNRAPLWIASPYATRGVINSDYYTQINVVKTIEQILGAQPLNQMDRAAVPISDAFTNAPDFTPYDAVPNNIPITQGATGLIPLSPPAGSSDTPTQAAALAATSGPSAPAVPSAERSVAAAWANWERTVAAPAIRAQGADSVNPAQMARYDWYTSTNWSRPYSGDRKILTPEQVPGRNLPSNFSGD